MAQIKSLSVKHDSIIDFLIAHPDMKLGLVAEQFGVSQPWLSTIIHTDIFQAALAEKMDGAFNATILPLREKMLGVAHVGIEKVGEALASVDTTNPGQRDFAVDTTDRILKSLGFSPNPQAPPGNTNNIQQNFYSVDRNTLASARDKMKAITPLALEEDKDAIEETRETPSP